MERKTQVGMLKVTYELLEDCLNLSGDHKIVDIYALPEDRQNNQFRVKISGPSMPILREGEPIIYIACVPDGKDKH